MNKRSTLILILILAVALLGLPGSGQAAARPLLTGEWEAIDVDGSSLRLSISGAPAGPFRLVWMESYISFCDGGSGIARGAATLDPSSANTLLGQLKLVCSSSAKTLDFEVAWTYDSGTDTLSADTTTWSRARAKVCLPPPAGLANWWPGDASPLDIASGRDLSLLGDAAYSSGLVKQAFLLDGSGDYLETPYHPNLNLGRGDFSVDLWVSFKSLAGEQVLIEQWVQSDTSRGWTLTKLGSDQLRLAMGDGSGWEFFVDSHSLPLRPKTWYHFAAVRAGSEISLFVNGVLVAAGDSGEPLNLNSAVPLKIGHRGSPEDTPGSEDERGFYLNGRVDEVQLFVGTALSGDQVRAIFNAASSGQCKDAIQPPPPLPHPIIWADPWADYINGWSWPEGNLIQIEVYDGEDLIYSEQQETRPDSGVGFSLWEAGLDLHAGQQVVLRDGTFSKQLWVTQLMITQVDLLAHTVTGIYDPAFSFQVLIDDQDPALLELDEAGWWQAQYAGDPARITLFQTDEDGDMTGIGTDMPNPRMVIFPEWEWMDGLDWPTGAAVAITVAGKEDTCSFERYVDLPEELTWSTFFNGNFPEGCDVVIGDTVSMAVGEIERTLTVAELHVSGVNEAASLITGWAFSGAEIEVWPHGGSGSVRVIAGDDGSWTADLSEVSPLWPGACGRAQINDPSGSATAVDWCVPNPRMVIFPEWEWMDGLDWPGGSTVAITVEGKEEACSLERYVDLLDEIAWSTFFNGNFPEGCDVVIGDTVMMTAGDIVRTHTVANLHVTGVDGTTHLVSGWADPGAELNVWAHEGSGAVHVVAGEDGSWTADLSEVASLLPGACGRSQIDDPNGSSTAVDWCVPNLVIVAQVDDAWFEGRGLYPGTEVVYTVLAEVEGEVLKSGVAVANEYGNAFVWTGGEFPLAPGQVITMQGAGMTKTLVIEALTFDFINTDSGYFSGWASGPGGRSLWVAYGGDYSFGELWLNTTDDGSWNGSFGGALPEDYWFIAAQIFDDDGDASEFRPAEIYSGGYPTNPTITAHLEHSWFEGRGFIPGSEISFAVADGETGEILHSGSVWADKNGSAHVYTFDLYPGLVLTMSCGELTRELVLEDLAFYSINLATGEVSGWAPGAAGRSVWIGVGWEDFGWSLELITAEDGAWSGSFGVPLPDGIHWIAAQIYDDDGDASEITPATIASGEG